MTPAAGPVGLISNPASGHNRDHFPQLQERIAQCASIQHIVTHGPGDIEPALRALRAAGIGVLAINGGDGTVSATLGCLLENRLFDPLPRIVLLPGGTANMNAGDVGLRGSLRRAVERLCRFAENGAGGADLQRRALMRVTGDGAAPRYGMFLGGGAVIHGTEYAHREIHSRGLRDDFSLALGTARTVWGVLRDDPRFNRHVRVSLALDGGEAKPFDTLILVASTLGRLSLGMRPFWGSGPGDIRVTVFEQGCSRFVRTFVSIVRGKPSANAVPRQGYHSFNAGRLHLEVQGRLNLDGEMFEAAGTLEIGASAPLEFLRL